MAKNGFGEIALFRPWWAFPHQHLDAVTPCWASKVAADLALRRRRVLWRRVSLKSGLRSRRIRAAGVLLRGGVGEDRCSQVKIARHQLERIFET